MTDLKFGDERSIAATAAAAASPIRRMYVSFGSTQGKTCADCKYFQSLDRGARCAVFQRTGKCTTWKSDNQACGKFEAISL